MTGGEFLYRAGFRTTRALDVSQGHPGVPVYGLFIPQGTSGSPYVRYGFTLTGKEIIPEQNAGAHARARKDGLRQSDAPFLLGLVAATKNTPIVSDLAQDASDLSYVAGATQWVLDQALSLGLVAIEPQSPAPPVAPLAPPPPASPPVLPPSPPPVNLHDTFDGMVWAQEFVRLHGGDVELMHSWFANAIMAGWDQARASGLPTTSTLHPLSPASVRVEELRLAFVPAVVLALPAKLGNSLSDLGRDATWSLVKPFAVEALRFYRRLRAKLGDTREIPAEDR